MGYGVVPRKILVLDPMLGWANPPTVLCMIFTHVFWTRWFSVHGIGCDGFQSMVLDASACINMYYNIERNIMKNQVSSPGIQGLKPTLSRVKLKNFSKLGSSTPFPLHTGCPILSQRLKNRARSTFAWIIEISIVFVLKITILLL